MKNREISYRYESRGFCKGRWSWYWGFPGGSVGIESPHSARDPGSITGLGSSPEKKMATHSNIVAWEILIPASIRAIMES